MPRFLLRALISRILSPHSSPAPFFNLNALQRPFQTTSTKSENNKAEPAAVLYFLNVVQLPSCVRLFVTPWTATHQASLSFTISQSLLKFMCIELMMPSNHLILCCYLLPLPSIFPRIMVFSSELALHIRWPKYWSFSFSISPSSECSGLISFRVDWFDHLAVQRTLKSLL